MDTEMYCWTPGGRSGSLPAEQVFDDWLDPAATAIACVDMHRSHVGDDPDMPVPAPRATDRVDAHNAFHRAAREVGVPVIMVQHWQRHGGTDDIKSQVVEGGTNWRHLEKIYMNLDQENMNELGWEGTKWVDLMVEEDPRDLYVRTKKRLSSFYPPTSSSCCARWACGTSSSTGRSPTAACSIRPSTRPTATSGS